MTKIKTSFSGHDKFDCKIDWITKGIKAYNDNPNIFLQSNLETSIEILGLGINMIKSLNHWMKVLGILENGILTDLGQNILNNDIYLENSDTLWILHWNLVKNIHTTTLCNLFFNKMYPNKFSKSDIENYMNLWMDDNNIKLSPVTLSSDIDVLIRLYDNNRSSNSMSLLSDLNIITKLSNNMYSLNINSTIKISDEVFLYILCDYIDIKYSNDAKSISVDDIQRGVLSLQKSLCMSESALYSKIHKLSKITDNTFSYSETAGMKQIYITNIIDKSNILDKIYKG